MPDVSDEIRLRSATEVDLGRIHEIEVESFQDPWSRAGFHDLLRNSLARVEVAENEYGAVVGFAVALFMADESEIADLAVAAAARRLGIGARLLDGLVATAGSFGTRSMFLDVRESNLAARRLYASRAFEIVGRRNAYYQKPDEDALIMRRTL